jgi:hypothetical protein
MEGGGYQLERKLRFLVEAAVEPQKIHGSNTATQKEKSN